MAHRGPAPKPNRIGHSQQAEWTEVPNTPFTAGETRDLPPLKRRAKWHDTVVAWWAIVRVMPHCALWQDSDWHFAVETAYAKDAFWKAYESGEATTAAATEIRRREDKMGTTAEARRQLRIRYVDAADKAPADGQVEAEDQVGNVTSIESRRDRLTA